MSDCNKELAEAVRKLAEAQAEGMTALVQSINQLAYEVKKLGNADANENMKAIENLAREVQKGAGSIASAIGKIADQSEWRDSN